jgi:hypothetical protein
MTQFLHRLSHEINALKKELNTRLEVNQNLNNREVYMLSVKLDKLIFEYQITSCKKKYLKKNRV